MKTRKPSILVSLLALAGAAQVSNAQTFTSGSTGAYGPMNITSNTVLQLPTNGTFNCTTITIASNVTLSFIRNSLNTPVHLLATLDVVINGTIDVSGSAPVAPFQGGAGGPGGFDGGVGGFQTGNTIIRGGAGMGPGGGRPGTDAPSPPNGVGAGAYGSRPGFVAAYGNTKGGETYGSIQLIPIVGGSGGGGVDGNQARGGGGGGGAVLIASTTRILLNASGVIKARGGYNDINNTYNGGSGGAIRLVAPRVYGTGTADVRGAFTPSHGILAGGGRIRVDSIFKYEPTNPAQENLSVNFQPINVTAVGATMIVFPPNTPRLDVVQAAGQAIPEGTPAPVSIELPFGSDTNRTVTVQARNFAASVPIRVVLTPQIGDPISYDTNIDNTISNPAQVTVNVGFPINQLVQVNAWTR